MVAENDNHYKSKSFDIAWKNAESWSDKEKYEKRVDDAYPILKEKARNRENITYGDLMNEIGTGRGFIGGILDGINRMEYAEERPLLSVFVIKKGEEAPGEGFYELLEDLGWLDDSDYSTSPSKKEKEEIAEDIREEAHDEWKT